MVKVQEVHKQRGLDMAHVDEWSDVGIAGTPALLDTDLSLHKRTPREGMQSPSFCPSCGHMFYEVYLIYFLKKSPDFGFM